MIFRSSLKTLIDWKNPVKERNGNLTKPIGFYTGQKMIFASLKIKFWEFISSIIRYVILIIDEFCLPSLLTLFMRIEWNNVFEMKLLLCYCNHFLRSFERTLHCFCLHETNQVLIALTLYYYERVAFVRSSLLSVVVSHNVIWFWFQNNCSCYYVIFWVLE